MEKAFFRERTKKEIKEGERIDLGRIVDVKELSNFQYGVLQSSILIPRGYQNARKFMKHGKEVKPKRFYSLRHALEYNKTPVQLREEAFNCIKDPYFCSYSFMPIGKDRRKRKVSLSEGIEGARIFANAYQTLCEKIRIKPYDDSRRVRIDGAEIIVSMPSRREGKPDLEFKLISIPVIDSNEKHKISLNFGSDHSCGLKRFNIRYKYIDDKESSGVINICAHEIAAYLKVVDYYWGEEKNIIPIQMCQFAIPTQETVDYYLKWEDNVLIFD